MKWKRGWNRYLLEAETNKQMEDNAFVASDAPYAANSDGCDQRAWGEEKIIKGMATLMVSYS
jgi:hypothetical protein